VDACQHRVGFLRCNSSLVDVHVVVVPTQGAGGATLDRRREFGEARDGRQRVQQRDCGALHVRVDHPQQPSKRRCLLQLREHRCSLRHQVSRVFFFVS
jgi:hypothetical protein